MSDFIAIRSKATILKMLDDEIKEARKEWIFKSAIYQSFSDQRGSVLVVKKLSKK